MNQILPGLYIGSLKDSRDVEQLKKNNITHILSVHEKPKSGLVKNIVYLCINIDDAPSENISQHFPICIKFIHDARKNNGNVLVHCVLGMSRSPTIVIAYIMTITDFSTAEATNVVKIRRQITNPNFGFQRQLIDFEDLVVDDLRRDLIGTLKNLKSSKKSDWVYSLKLLKQFYVSQIKLVDIIVEELEPTTPISINSNSSTPNKTNPMYTSSFDLSKLNNNNGNNSGLNIKYASAYDLSKYNPIQRSTLDLARILQEPEQMYSEKYFRDLVAYGISLDHQQVLKSIDLTKEHVVVVCDVNNPHEIHVQLYENLERLNNLMSELDKEYYGTGSALYDMKREYIKLNEYCAALYSEDKNWHRCKIIDIDYQESMVNLLYIDYGGCMKVSMDNLKFLKRAFIDFPPQAILISLANVLYPNGLETWKEGTTEYLVSVCTGTKYSVKFNEDLEKDQNLILKDVTTTGSIISLNQTIINDGFGSALVVNKKMCSEIFIKRIPVYNSHDVIRRDLKLFLDSLGKKLGIGRIKQLVVMIKPRTITPEQPGDSHKDTVGFLMYEKLDDHKKLLEYVDTHNIRFNGRTLVFKPNKFVQVNFEN